MYKKNVLTVILKVVATLILLAGVITGLSVISTTNDNPVVFSSTYTGIWIIISSIIISLFFFALSEIINLLYDVRNTNKEIKYHISQNK